MNAHSDHIFKPLHRFGFTHPFWNVQADTIISTWIILAILIILGLYISQCLKNKNSKVRYVTIAYVKTFQELVAQSINHYKKSDVAMIATFFTFIFLCNSIQFFPWLEEPTKDLNSTLAFGLISFLYVHGSSIAHKGFLEYIKHYFQPFVFMFPLHIIGAISSVVSLAFRLFGNIFGGYTISALYGRILSGSVLAQTVGLIGGFNIAIFIVFGIFEGLIQAFVFTMLTLTYLSMEISQDHE